MAGWIFLNPKKRSLDSEWTIGETVAVLASNRVQDLAGLTSLVIKCW